MGNIILSNFSRVDIFPQNSLALGVCVLSRVETCMFKCSNRGFAFITSDKLRLTAFSVTMETGNEPVRRLR